MRTRTLMASALMTPVMVAASFSIVTTTAETQDIEYDGKRYACCNESCHKMASKDKARTGKSAIYLEAGEKTFAACSKECRDDLAKDLTKATRRIEAKLAAHRHAH